MMGEFATIGMSNEKYSHQKHGIGMENGTKRIPDTELHEHTQTQTQTRTKDFKLMEKVEFI